MIDCLHRDSYMDTTGSVLDQRQHGDHYFKKENEINIRRSTITLPAGSPKRAGAGQRWCRPYRDIYF